MTPPQRSREPVHPTSQGPSRLPRGYQALSVALLYAGVSSLWILLSDRLVGWLVHEPWLAQAVGTLKGWLFVALSATLIYALLRRRSGGGEGRDLAPRAPWLAIVLLGATIAAVTGVAVEQAWRGERRQASDRLEAISLTKTQQLSDWYDERIREARLLQQRIGISQMWQQSATTGGELPEALIGRLQALVAEPQVQRVALFDGAARLHWVSRGPALANDPTLQGALQRALASGRVGHVGPWRDGQGLLRLAFLSPIAAGSSTPAVIVMYLDPHEDIHTSLQGWPLPQETAETLLFRRDGDDVLFLSDLRYEAGAAARKRQPLATSNAFTARVLRGEVGPGMVLDGLDYRGVSSLAVARPIGASGWWLLAKQDRSELLMGALEDSLWMAVAAALAVVSLAVTLYMSLQRRRLMMSARDIRDLRRIERELGESESRYRLLAENGSDVVWLYDLRERRLAYVSPSALRLTGYSADEVRLRPLTALFTPASTRLMTERLPQRLSAFQSGDESARTHSDELEQSHRDGGAVPIEVVSTLITDDVGEVIQILGVTRDITARKRAEAQLLKLSQATEQSPAGVIITGLDASIEYVNAAFERNSGYRREEVLGRNPRLLQSGRTPREVYTGMWLALQRGEPWSGEMINRHKDGHEYVQAVTIAPVRDDTGRTSHFVSVQLDVTAQRQAEEQAHRLAWYDTLTGLANRHRLLDELGDALGADRRLGQHSALLLINLDRFKTLNDALGHDSGDAVLRLVAERLQTLTQADDLLARLSADEFALLKRELESEMDVASAHAMRAAQAVHQALLAPFALDSGESLDVGASVGVCVLPAGAADSPGEVLRRADTALHRAKASGGRRSAFFDQTMGRVVSERFAIEQDLRRGLAAGELRLYLQPQVNADGRMVSAEALVRWQHPEQGLVPPGIFIPVAEESDLITDLGDWVLHEVCHHLGRLRRQGWPLPISVNVSPRQFHRADFVARVLRQLADSGAHPADLMLEITEGVVVDQVELVIRKMSQLTSHGVQFSIDDFGTGYSSLAYLKRLPIHELKIDKGFVQDAPRDANGAAVVEAILSVARHLHLKVVAEGVETQEQADFLNARGQVVHQGFLYGRPEPVEALLSRWLDGEAAAPSAA